MFPRFSIKVNAIKEPESGRIKTEDVVTSKLDRFGD